MYSLLLLLLLLAHSVIIIILIPIFVQFDIVFVRLVLSCAWVTFDTIGNAGHGFI